MASSTSNLLPSISSHATNTAAVQDTASKLQSKLQLLNASQQQQQASKRNQEGMKALGKGRRPPRERRLTAPSALPRITSWSDPKSARGLIGAGVGSFGDGLERRGPSQDEGDQTRSEESDDEGSSNPMKGNPYAFGEDDGDDPTPLPRTARPFSSTPIHSPQPTPHPTPQRPKLKRRNLTSSLLSGSDGEMFVAKEKSRFQSLLGADADGLAALDEEEGMVYEIDFSGDDGEGDGWMRRHRSMKRRGYHDVGFGRPLMRFVCLVCCSFNADDLNSQAKEFPGP